MADLDMKLDSNAGPVRCAGPSVQDVLRAEAVTQPVPANLLEESYVELGTLDIPVERYTSYAFHRREVEHVWGKAWQLACREEDVPAAGDQLVYDIADKSILLVRDRDGEIKAFHNVCLHRGRLLRTEDGHAPSIRCSFHGWTWNLDGELKSVPSQWDFPHVEPDKFCLPKVKVGRWGGFVFVNLDAEAGSLEDHLDVVPRHFDEWTIKPADRVKVAHVAAIVDCNWKVAMEAFIEGYHGPATHPQMAYYVGDINTQYDVYGDHVSRLITLEGVVSPTLKTEVDAKTIVHSMAFDLGIGSADDIAVPEGAAPRTVLANYMRTLMSGATGRDLSRVADAEMLEAVQYFVFPNIMPWAGTLSMVYRFRPNGDDQHSAIVDLMLLMPRPAGAQPGPVAMRWLPRNPDWREATEFGVLGPIFNQDMQNLPHIQRGLRAAVKEGVTVSRYQEIRIRHLHRTLGRYVGD